MAQHLFHSPFHPRRRSIRRVQLSVTQLEERLVPYTGGNFMWTGAHDQKTWEDAGNWDVTNLPGQGQHTDSWPGQSGASAVADNVTIDATDDNIVTASNFEVGSLSIDFGAATGSLTINHNPGILGLGVNGTLFLYLGAGTLKNYDTLIVDDGHNDNTWTSGNILGSGTIEVQGNTGLTFKRFTDNIASQSPGKLQNNLTVGNPAGGDTSTLTIGNLNQNIAADANLETVTVYPGASMYIKTDATSNAFRMGASDLSVETFLNLYGNLYRDCGSAPGMGRSFTLGYACHVESGGALEIYDAPSSGPADELDFANWYQNGPNQYAVWNDGGSVILGQAPDPNRSGTATLGVTIRGLYQTSGHLETKGSHTEEIDTGSYRVDLEGGDMTFSADNPQSLGDLNVYGNFVFGRGATWNWYGGASSWDKLSVLQVNGAQGSVSVASTTPPSIVCSAPAGQKFGNVIGCASHNDSGNPTNFTLSNGFSGKWNGNAFEIDS
jgi:hypothetical protein